MKINSRYVLLVVILIIVINLFPTVTNAQIIGFTSGDPDAPIDGGVSVLIAAGVGYGIKKAKDSRKKKIMDNQS